MAKCPKCKKEIDYFRVSAYILTYGCYDGYDWDMGEQDNLKEEEYSCPECYEILFEDNEKARKFLNG